MKKTKIGVVMILCVLLAAAAITMVGCGPVYRPYNVSSVEEGYTVVWGKNPMSEYPKYAYSVKNAEGKIIGVVQVGGTVEDGKILGIGSDEKNVSINIILDTAYDYEAIKVSVNGREVPYSGIWPIQSTGSLPADASFSTIGYEANADDNDQKFQIDIGGFQLMTIGGHKWKLYGVKDDNGFYEPSSEYGDGLYIGSNVDYRFDYQPDGRAVFDMKEGDDQSVEEGTWEESDGVLRAATETGSEFEMFFLPQEERKNYIDQNTVVGPVVVWRIGDALHTEYFFVLDVIS